MTCGGSNFIQESVGNPAVFRQTIHILSTLGVCGLVGVVALNTEVSPNSVRIADVNLHDGDRNFDKAFVSDRIDWLSESEADFPYGGRSF